MNYIDLTGMIYGRWTVIKRAEDYISPKGRHEAKWLCKCECGNIGTIRTSDLRSGGSKSCGCLKKNFVFCIIENTMNTKSIMIKNMFYVLHLKEINFILIWKI